MSSLEPVRVLHPAAGVERLCVVEGVFDGLEYARAHTLVEAQDGVVEASVGATEGAVLVDREFGAGVVAGDAGVSDDGRGAGVKERVERSSDEELGQLEGLRPAQIVREVLAAEGGDHADANEESRIPGVCVNVVVPAVVREVVPAREGGGIIIPIEEEGILGAGGGSIDRSEADTERKRFDASGELLRVGADVLAFACPGEAFDVCEGGDVCDRGGLDACMKNHLS